MSNDDYILTANQIKKEPAPKGMYQNPLVEGADPFVLTYGGKYYLYATNADDGY